MQKRHLKQSIPALAIAAGALSASTAWAGSQARSHVDATAAKAKKYKGPMVDMRWGPVQATITVKNKKITAVSILTSPENSRSQFIDDQAVPMLRQETLQAQTGTVDEVSGATMTSDAFIESLQSAISKARRQKALK